MAHSPHREAREHKRSVASPHLVKMLGADARMSSNDEPDDGEAACSALGSACEWPITCAERNSCAYGEQPIDRGEATQPVELYDEAAFAAFDLARNVGKGERLARRDADIALDLQVQYQGAIGELPR